MIIKIIHSVHDYYKLMIFNANICLVCPNPVTRPPPSRPCFGCRFTITIRIISISWNSGYSNPLSTIFAFLFHRIHAQVHDYIKWSILDIYYLECTKSSNKCYICDSTNLQMHNTFGCHSNFRTSFVSISITSFRYGFSLFTVFTSTYQDCVPLVYDCINTIHQTTTL